MLEPDDATIHRFRANAQEQQQAASTIQMPAQALATRPALPYMQIEDLPDRQYGRKVLNDWGGADFQDIMAGLDYVLTIAPIDEQRLGVGGLSYGGYMTNWAITQTNRFKAAVSRNGISSLPDAALLSDQTIWFNLCMPEPALQRERSALTFADRITTPLLLLHAKQDLRCPFSQAMQLFVALRKRKHPVELVCYHQAGHLMDWPQVGSPQQRLDRLRRTVA